MTRKDYQAVADIIRENPDMSEVGFANKMSELFAEDNPRFEPSTFFKACGLTSDRKRGK